MVSLSFSLIVEQLGVELTISYHFLLMRCSKRGLFYGGGLKTHSVNVVYTLFSLIALSASSLSEGR